MTSSQEGYDLCAFPAETPPDLQVSNFVNPPSLAATTIAVTTVTLVCAVVLTGARVATRFRKLGLADYFVIIALVLSAAYAGLVLSILKFARHQWNIPACWYNGTYVKFLYASSVMICPTVFFAKCSIFLLLLQIFTIHEPMKIAIWIGIAFTTLLYWAGLPLSSYFNAPHVGETWQELLYNGRPHRLTYWAVVQGACSVVLDIYIFTLPLPLLAQLQMPRKRRLQLFAIFSTALMGIIASVCALVFRVQLLDKSDTSYIQSAVFICIIVENNVAIIVSSMPFFPTFLRNHVLETGLFKSLRSKLTGHRQSSNRSAYIQGSRIGASNPGDKGWKHSNRNLLEDNTPVHGLELQEVPKLGVAVQVQAGSRSASSQEERGINRQVKIKQDTHSMV